MMKKADYTFNLYIKSSKLTIIPRGSGIRVVVNIWRRKKDMNDYYNASKLHYRLDNQEHARTSWHTVKNESFAEVNFFHLRMGVEYVAHEFSHVGVFWANHAGLTIQTPSELRDYTDEEIFVRVVSKLIKQFYQKIHKLNLTFAEDLLESRALD